MELWFTIAVAIGKKTVVKHKPQDAEVISLKVWILFALKAHLQMHGFAVENSS